MVRPPARLLLLLAAVSAAVVLAACGATRAGGAGDLTATSRSASTPASTPASTSTSTARRSRHRADATTSTAHVTFASTRLRGTPHSLRLPRGWQAELWARVPGARLEAWTPQGSLLVSSPGEDTVTELTPHRGRPPSARTIITGLTNPQGLAFDSLGGHEYLYVAASNGLYCFRWTAQGTAVDRTTTVADLPDTGPSGADVHRMKNVVVGAHHTLFVDIGSASNASIPAPTPRGGLPRASVIQVDPTTNRFHGRATVHVFATGVRNGDGLAIAPDGSLWTAVNERDQIAYPFHRADGGHADAYGQVIPAYVDNHPPDEVAKLTRGRDLGWPYCDPDPDVHPGSPTTALRYGDLPFTADEQTNPRDSRLNCARLAPLQRGLPAHSAPLGLSFLTGSTLPAPWRDGAVVAAHGSWDRQPPRPPVVYWMPWEARQHTLGPAVTLVSGFQDADGVRWGRLADAVAGPDGSLYVTDDQSGAVYRITP